MARITQPTTKSNVLSLGPSSLEECLAVLAFLNNFRWTSFNVVFGASVGYQLEHLESSIQTAAELWDVFFVQPAAGSPSLSATNKDPDHCTCDATYSLFLKGKLILYSFTRIFVFKLAGLELC